MSAFLYYYVRSMRLYYSFVTGSTVLAGLVYGIKVSGAAWTGTTTLVLLMGCLAWGINQIFNDWGNLAEDRINAPHRPMVNGSLQPAPALVLSAVLLLTFGIVSWLVNPWTLVPLAFGAGLNFAYCLAKGVPILGCFVYGASITCCFFYGYIVGYGTSNSLPPFLDWGSLQFWDVAVSLWLIHALMCHASYFKDILGDKTAGKRTFQVVFGYQASLYAGLAGSTALLYYFYRLIDASLTTPGPSTVWQAAGPVIAVVWSIVLIINLYIRLFRREYHAACCANCESCAALTLLVTTVASAWFLAVIAAAWLSIQLLFLWYKDEQE